jgi:hypothetical protein
LECTHVVEKVFSLFFITIHASMCDYILWPSLTHLSSGLNRRQLFWWLSIMLYFFSPPVISFSPIYVCEPVLFFFKTCACVRACLCVCVCVSSAEFLQHHSLFAFSHWMLLQLAEDWVWFLLCSTSVFLINSPSTLGKVTHSFFLL